MLNCKRKVKHNQTFPEHKEFLHTSTQYCSEAKMCELALRYNKMFKKEDGNEYIISPFNNFNYA